jgi:hypothetical protein
MTLAELIYALAVTRLGLVPPHSDRALAAIADEALRAAAKFNAAKGAPVDTATGARSG